MATAAPRRFCRCAWFCSQNLYVARYGLHLRFRDEQQLRRDYGPVTRAGLGWAGVGATSSAGRVGTPGVASPEVQTECAHPAENTRAERCGQKIYRIFSGPVTLISGTKGWRVLRLGDVDFARLGSGGSPSR